MASSKPLRSCRLDDSLYLKVKYLADQENRSFNNYLEALLIKLVSEYEAQHGEIKVNPEAK